MVHHSYRYELPSSNTTIATGHLSTVEPLSVGDRIEIAGSQGIARTFEPIVGERELRLVVVLVSAAEAKTS